MSRCNGIETCVRAPQRIPDLRPQLELYARDLKRVLAEEEERTRQLEMANRQLHAYAQDLKSALLAERQQSRELERSYHDTVLRLLGATRCRDHETGEHVVRIAHYARRLALCTGWAAPEAELLFEAAPMHDLGKIGVPDVVLLKPGPLTEEAAHRDRRRVAFRLPLSPDRTGAADRSHPPRTLGWHGLSARAQGTGNPSGGPRGDAGGPVRRLAHQTPLQARAQPSSRLPSYARRRRPNPPPTLRSIVTGGFPRDPLRLRRYSCPSQR
jgi:hypothetical protein